MRLSLTSLLFILSCCAATKPAAFEIQLNESKPNFSNTATLEIRALKSDGQPVEGLKIELVNSHIQTSTNHLGIATIKLADPLFKDRLKIFSASIPIDLKGYDRIIALVID